jgi:hypothetical protein
MRNNKILKPFIVSSAITFYAASANALIAVRAIELSAPDVKPVIAVELASPTLSPVAAQELTAIAAIELTPATLSESDQGEDNVYKSVQAKIPQPDKTQQANAEFVNHLDHASGMNTVETESQSAPVSAIPQKTSTTSDYNPAVY